MKSPVKLLMVAAAGAAAMFLLVFMAVVMPASQIPVVVQTANELDTVPLELRDILETEATAAGVSWYDLAAYLTVTYRWKLPIPSLEDIATDLERTTQPQGIWRANAVQWIKDQLAALGPDIAAHVPADRWEEFRNIREAIQVTEALRKENMKDWQTLSDGETYQLVLSMRDWFLYDCPVPGATFTNDWGFDRPQNAGYASTRHQGTDLFAPRGTQIHSANAGVVYSMGWNYLGGRTVTVQDPSGALLYYAHMQGYGDIVKGSRVRPGQVLGYVGTSGEGPEPTDNVIGESHLHLGIYLPDGATNPFPYVSKWCGHS